MCNNRMLCTIALIISAILVMISLGVLIHAKSLGVSSGKPHQVLYPKQNMTVNQISDNTIVVTTLNFEDAVKEINQCKDQFKEADNDES